MKSVGSIFRYRRNPAQPEERKGLRVISQRTGFPVYTSRATISRGGYVEKEIGPRFIPKTNTWE